MNNWKGAEGWPHTNPSTPPERATLWPPSRIARPHSKFTARSIRDWNTCLIVYSLFNAVVTASKLSVADRDTHQHRHRNAVSIGFGLWQKAQTLQNFEESVFSKYRYVLRLRPSGRTENHKSPLEKDTNLCRNQKRNFSQDEPGGTKSTKTSRTCFTVSEKTEHFNLDLAVSFSMICGTATSQ